MSAPSRQDDSRSLAQQLTQMLTEITPAERRAAHMLLANYPVLGLETVAEFARRAHVSAPTILRLVAKLGLSGYPEFQRCLRTELEAQAQSPLSKERFSPSGEIPPDQGTGLASRLQRFQETVAANIAETFRNVPAAEFEAVVGLLADEKRRIYLIGGRFTDGIGRYMSAHLRIVRPGVTHLIGQADNWRDHLLDMGSRDVLIVFDIRRYSEDLTVLAAEAAKRRVTVVLMTDQWLSPVAGSARHVLAARVLVPSNWDSTAAILTLVEALLAATTEQIWPSASRRIAALEEMRGRAADGQP